RASYRALAGILLVADTLVPPCASMLGPLLPPAPSPRTGLGGDGEPNPCCLGKPLLFGKRVEAPRPFQVGRPSPLDEKITIIGIGDHGFEGLTRHAHDLIAAAGTVMGPPNLLEKIERGAQQFHPLPADLAHVADDIAAAT